MFFICTTRTAKRYVQILAFSFHSFTQNVFSTEYILFWFSHKWNIIRTNLSFVHVLIDEVGSKPEWKGLVYFLQRELCSFLSFIFNLNLFCFSVYFCFSSSEISPIRYFFSSSMGSSLNSSRSCSESWFYLSSF